jgi:hypothetical protein
MSLFSTCFVFVVEVCLKETSSAIPDEVAAAVRRCDIRGVGVMIYVLEIVLVNATEQM